MEGQIVCLKLIGCQYFHRKYFLQKVKFLKNQDIHTCHSSAWPSYPQTDFILFGVSCFLGSFHLLGQKAGFMASDSRESILYRSQLHTYARISKNVYYETVYIFGFVINFGVLLQSHICNHTKLLFPFSHSRCLMSMHRGLAFVFQKRCALLNN